MFSVISFLHRLFTELLLHYDGRFLIYRDVVPMLQRYTDHHVRFIGLFVIIFGVYFLPRKMKLVPQFHTIKNLTFYFMAPIMI